MRRRTALLCLITVVSLAGCDSFSLRFGGLDTAQLEDEILAELQAEFPVQLDAVECPDGVQPAAGDVFVCRVMAADGSVGTVEVEQVDGDGQVEWELTDVQAPADQATER